MPDGPGLGVELDRDKLAEYAELYEELGDYPYDRDPGRPDWFALVPNEHWAHQPMIETLYVANHTHTDIGFTDHQDVCFRQHAEFITQAMDLIEATAGYPEEARFRWTCEVTGPLERYFDTASDDEAERFRRHNASGAMDVAAMQYNLTPLLRVEQMVRSLCPLRRLRERTGCRSAARCRTTSTASPGCSPICCRRSAWRR